MASLVTKTLSRLWRPSLLEVSTQRWSKVSCIAKRWSSSQSIGSSPSQLSVPGEFGWAGFEANVKRYNYQPPISPAEIQHGQEMYEMKQKFAQIEEMFSKIVQSNERLGGEVKHLIQILHIHPQN